MLLPLRCVLLLIVALGCTESTGPGSGGPPAILAFVSQLGQPRLIRISPSGTATATLLTEPGAWYSNLRPSPDGSVILFNRLVGGGTLPGPLYQMSASGGGLAPFPGIGESPVWSPDGSRLAWLVDQYAGRTITITDAHGGSPDPVGLAESMTWSPDGLSLAITYRPSNTDQEIGTIALTGIRTRVNRTAARGDDRLPAWSLDGSKLAFYSERAPTPGLYVMNADGSDQRLLAAATLNTAPAWADDGNRIAFIDYTPVDGSPRLRLVKLDGAEIPLSPAIAMRVESFSWSPSGTQGLIGGRDSLGRSTATIASASFAQARLLPLGTLLDPQVAWLQTP